MNDTRPAPPTYVGSNPQFDDPALRALWLVLDRGGSISTMEALQAAVSAPATSNEAFYPQDTIAFGFDTNAVYRVGQNGGRGLDALDYFGRHNGPIIVPGQVIQELWNNLHAHIAPASRPLKTNFDGLKKEAAKLGRDLGTAGAEAETSINLLLSNLNSWFDPESSKIILQTIAALSAVAESLYVPRVAFHCLANVRHQTKTPPGFKDPADSHGDFYVWADFLYTLASTNLSDVSRVVLVSNDAKLDWWQDRKAHPILVAEVRALVDKPFEIWPVDRFQTYVQKST